MKKLISFSLFQDPILNSNSRLYWLGAMRNIEAATDIYPGWTLRFYVDDTMPKIIIRALEKDAEVVLKKRDSRHSGRFWRFAPISEPDLDVVIMRDCDSVIGEKEALAVDEWLQSGKTLHIMRDHKHHAFIPAGMWGMRNNKVGNFETLVNRYLLSKKEIVFNDDEKFLRKEVYPLFKDDCFIHGYSKSNDEIVYPFPIPKVSSGKPECEFVGKQNFFLKDIKWAGINPLTLKPIVKPLSLYDTLTFYKLRTKFLHKLRAKFLPPPPSKK